MTTQTTPSSFERAKELIEFLALDVGETDPHLLELKDIIFELEATYD